ncbi:sarcosine oxidase subunit gamma [Puniceibacterium confluentis]|uniref:sarcosine oxidase subunit gamma n=1 Tax=Puniceibacterium confluentis TaxID=1958944 RepID=UPI0011B75553|nr:sarcosine oxidase subunit gamma family protein [Puniceibacterium confluentis]
MSEPVSALSNASFDGLVHVQEAGLHGMIALRGDLDSEALQSAVTNSAGVGVPAPRTVVFDGARGAAWMSPDELLVFCPYPEAGATLAQLTDALGGAHALAVDVSDARAVFEVRGPRMREVIAKLAPVDMSAAAFQPGTIRRTRFAQVAAAVWLVDDAEARIVCFRSVAPYMFALLCTAAAPGGEVGMF